MRAFVVMAVLLLAVGFALAAEKAPAVKVVPNGTNMTYGQCVSAAAAVKNTCYSDVKDARKACIEAAKNASTSDKQCKADYKKELKVCKDAFKSAKTDCAKTYKPGFFAKMKSSMK